MKLMVYNTQHCQNYITKKIDFECISSIIKNSGADIVGLNEIRGDGPDAEYTDQTGILAKLAGYPYQYFAPALDIKGKGLYGNALLSKLPFLSTERIFVPDAPRLFKGYYETRCLIKAKFQNGLTVMVIHFGLMPNEQEAAVKTVLEHLENEKCILMGDFNVTPDNKVLDPIRERMRDTAELFRTPLLSFPSDKPDRKIDYIFTSPDVEVISADIPAIIGADHRPHIAEIKL